MPDRVNKLEQETHTLKHRVEELEKDLSTLPERMTKAEMQLAQLLTLPAKLDLIRDEQKEQQHSLKRYLGWMSGAAATFMFLLIYGDKVAKFIGKLSIA